MSVETTSRLSSTVRDLSRAIGDDSPVQAVLDRLVISVRELVPGSRAGVSLGDAAGDLGDWNWASSDPDTLCLGQLQAELGEGPGILASRSGEPCLAVDLVTDRRFPAFGPRAVDAGRYAAFAFPLQHDDTSFGVLDIYCGEPGMPTWIAEAQLLAGIASAFIASARARERFLELAETLRLSSNRDPLTGLANRALLIDRLAQALRRCGRSGRPTAVLFVDIDHFKAINDEFGHSAGDTILSDVGRRLEQVVRPADTVARLGGDEFVILCEEIDERTDAVSLAARIEETLEDPFKLDGGPVTIRASIGVALADSSSDPPAEVLDDADRDMYRVKRTRQQSLVWPRHPVVRILGLAGVLPRQGLAWGRGQLARGFAQLAVTVAAGNDDRRVLELEAELRKVRQVNDLLRRTAIFVEADLDIDGHFNLGCD